MSAMFHVAGTYGAASQLLVRNGLFSELSLGMSRHGSNRLHAMQIRCAKRRLGF